MLLRVKLGEMYVKYISKCTLPNYLRHIRVRKKIESLIPLTLSRDIGSGDEIDSTLSSDAPIYVFWWQGEENIPLIPKICVERIKKMSGEHPVHFISKDNVRKYSSTIPESVYNLLEQKTITLQYFSDILRTDLLYNNGGIWLDATIWPCLPIDEIIHSSSGFYTGRRRTRDVGNLCVSKGRWTGYFMSTNANSSLMKFIRDGLIESAINYNGVIDYLAIDYLFDIAYNKSEHVRMIIKSIPPVPNTFWSLLPFLGQVVDNVFWDNVLQESPFYKLNWRMNCKLEVEGCKTLLGYLAE